MNTYFIISYFSLMMQKEKCQVSIAYFEIPEGTSFPLPSEYICKKPFVDSTHSRLYLTYYKNAKGVKRQCVAKVSKKMMMDSEYTISAKLDHENILTPLGMYRDDKRYVIFVPYCENGTLEDVALNPLRITERSCKFMFKQMVKAVGYLHEHLIIHNDIKPENFLVDGATVKLADFGLSYRLLNANSLDPHLVGTPMYMAPEIHAGAGHNLSADIWSLGVCLHFLYYRTYPYNGNNLKELKNSMFHSKWKSNSRIGSNDLEDIIKYMLTISPSERPSVKQILSHPWFTSKTVMSARGVQGDVKEIEAHTYHHTRSKTA